jgi:integrase
VVVCDELAFFRSSEGFPTDVEMLRALRPTPATTGGLSPRTTNAVLTTGAAVFDFAMRRQLVKLNPFELAERLRANPADFADDDEMVTEEDIYSEDELKKLLVAEPSRKYRVLFLLGVLVGPRRPEMLALQWSDLILDTEAPYVRIRRSVSFAKDPRIDGTHPASG